MNQTNLPSARGFPDQPQGKVCPPVQNGRRVSFDESPPEKKCIRCGLVKDLSLFSKLSKSKDGRSSYCKKCHNEVSNKSKEVCFTCPHCGVVRKTRLASLSKLTKEQKITKIYPCRRCCLIGSNVLPDNGSLNSKLYYSYKKGAKQRGKEFSLSKEFFSAMVSQNCHYCNGEPNNTMLYSKGSDRKLKYSGLDRVDNTKGYVAGNVVPCCFQCNKAKQTMSSSDFSRWITNVYDNFCSKR